MTGAGIVIDGTNGEPGGYRLQVDETGTVPILVSTSPLADATGGYRAYRREVLDRLPLAEVASQGYCFQVDLAWQAWRAGHTVVEVPITFVERERGESKMSRAIVVEALWRVTWWGVTSRRSHPRTTTRSSPALVAEEG